jgi:hypothetical protein
VIQPKGRKESHRRAAPPQQSTFLSRAITELRFCEKLREIPQHCFVFVSLSLRPRGCSVALPNRSARKALRPRVSPLSPLPNLPNFKPESYSLKIECTHDFKPPNAHNPMSDSEARFAALEARIAQQSLQLAAIEGRLSKFVNCPWKCPGLARKSLH